MIQKNLTALPAHLAGDHTDIQEIIHPKNDGVDLPYSLAMASLGAGKSSLPHRLVGSIEIYFIVEGTGEMHLDEQVFEVGPGSTVFIPANALQWIANTGDAPLRFLCIVSPPWRADEEVIVHLPKHP